MAVLKINNFQSLVYGFYSKNYRSFPWRYHPDPYAVLVSEVMLQQTQTSRVIDKYNEFYHTYPTIQDLADAPPSELLALWSGLGYNRRCLDLKSAAQAIVTGFGGQIPRTVQELDSMPGIGPSTAAAVCVYAFNLPIAFIETNIRTVFIHHFFKTGTDITDRQLMPLVEETMDKSDPRRWFYALTDYGVYLKKTVGNVNIHSRHYRKQSPFAGSNRQLRGLIIRLLLKHRQLTYKRLLFLTKTQPELLNQALSGLVKQKLLFLLGRYYFLDDSKNLI